MEEFTELNTISTTEVEDSELTVPAYIATTVSVVSPETDLHTALRAAIDAKNVGECKKRLKECRDSEQLFELCKFVFNKINGATFSFLQSELKEILRECFIQLFSLSMRDDFLMLLNRLKPDEIKAIIKLAEYEVRVKLDAVDKHKYKNIGAGSRDFTVEELRELDHLRNGVSKSFVLRHGVSVREDEFTEAAYQGNIPKLQVLKNAGHDFAINGVTGLHCAVAAGRVRVVKFLLSHSADITAQDHKKRTPLQLATDPEIQEILRITQERSVVLKCSVPVPSFQTMQRFMSVPFSPKDAIAFILYVVTVYANSVFDQGLTTALMIELIDIHPSIINEKLLSGKTVLFYARTAQQVQLLLDRGANPNALNDFKQRPNIGAQNEEVRVCILKAQQALFEREYPAISALLTQLVVGEDKFTFSVDVMRLIKSPKMIAFFKEQEKNGCESLCYLIEVIDKVCEGKPGYKSDFEVQLLLAIHFMESPKIKDGLKYFVASRFSLCLFLQEKQDPNFTLTLFFLLHRERINSEYQIDLFRAALRSQHPNAVEIMKLLMTSYDVKILDKLNKDDQAIAKQRLGLEMELQTIKTNMSGELDVPPNVLYCSDEENNLTLSSNMQALANVSFSVPSVSENEGESDYESEGESEGESENEQETLSEEMESSQESSKEDLNGRLRKEMQARLKEIVANDKESEALMDAAFSIHRAIRPKSKTNVMDCLTFRHHPMRSSELSACLRIAEEIFSDEDFEQLLNTKLDGGYYPFYLIGLNLNMDLSLSFPRLCHFAKISIAKLIDSVGDGPFNISAVFEYVARGGDIEAPVFNNFTMTPLEYAIANQQWGTAEGLLKLGADVNAISAAMLVDLKQATQLQALDESMKKMHESIKKMEISLQESLVRMERLQARERDNEVLMERLKEGALENLKALSSLRLSINVQHTGSPLHSPRTSRNDEPPQSRITLNSNNEEVKQSSPGVPTN